MSSGSSQAWAVLGLDFTVGQPMSVRLELMLALRGQLKVGQGFVSHTRSTWQVQKPATPPSSAGQRPGSPCAAHL